MDGFQIWSELMEYLSNKFDTFLHVGVAIFWGLWGGIVKVAKRAKEHKAITFASFLTTCFIASSIGAFIGLLLGSSTEYSIVWAVAFTGGYVGSKPLDMIEKNLEKVLQKTIDKWIG